MKNNIVIILILACAIPRVFACSCDIPELPEMVDRADVIFYGRCHTLTLDDPSTELREPLTMTARFEVEEIFKGEPDSEETIDVKTALDGASCGFNFRVGRYYIVYASKRSGIIRTNICTRTIQVGVPARIANNEEYAGISDLLRDPEIQGSRQNKPEAGNGEKPSRQSDHP